MKCEASWDKWVINKGLWKGSQILRNLLLHYSAKGLGARGKIMQHALIELNISNQRANPSSAQHG